MKWIGLAALFCLLVVTTIAAWNRRFEAVEGSPLVSVEDGSGVGFALKKGRGDNPIARTVVLPLGESVGILHVRFSFRAVDLVGGGEKWEDGRLILDWVDAGGRVVKHDTLITMVGSDKSSSVEMIVRSVGKGLSPVLRVEHLGLSGRMEVHSLQAIAVRERLWVAWVTGGLLGVWGVWCYGFVRCLTKVGRWRVVCASVVVLMMGWFLVVPGPWAHERPLAGNFQMESEPDAVARVVMASEGGMALDVKPLGEMPMQGSWLLWVKKALSMLRPVLHVMLFAGPALVIAVLCGMRCAWWCGVLVSCMVEMGQAGFGYGVDWLDAIDLMVDWAGIGGAIWVYWKARERFLEPV